MVSGMEDRASHHGVIENLFPPTPSQGLFLNSQFNRKSKNVD